MDVTELLLGLGPATRSRLASVGEGVTKIRTFCSWVEHSINFTLTNKVIYANMILGLFNNF
ncbi:MAG: hypothetical protein A4E56_02641 [Pelotomaculum sp. PtaU1.Bin065]|nr:MAG: hypothetical protein A4E56_02641 [Pelotomaculum sp. PtaU1.Bin065]